MIIPWINQKLLIADQSQEESYRVTNILDNNHIEYYIKTLPSNGNMLASRYTDLSVANKVAFGMTVDSINQHVYFVYVKRRDYKHAKELISH